jgi:energy-coupling factor transport system substrate-specific component
MEVFVMSNKLQAKDLINLGLFTVLYFVIGCCVAIPVGFVPIFLPILGIVVFDYRHPVHAVPDQS